MKIINKETIMILSILWITIFKLHFFFFESRNLKYVFIIIFKHNLKLCLNILYF